MANYPLPPWLSPSAAQGWGELAGQAARSRAQIQMERDRLSQQAAQFAVESAQRSQEVAAAAKARQDQTNYEHLMDQQKIAIDQAYQQQQIGLKKQDMDLAEREFQQKATQAANKFAAHQAFQKSMLPKEQGGEGLTPEQAALKYISPYMTGTEVGRLATMPHDFQPGKTFPIPNSKESLVQVAPNHWVKYATVPETITNAPTAMSVADEEGKVTGHLIQVPGMAPHYQPATDKADSVDEILKKRLEERQGKTKASTTVDSGQLAKNEVIRIVNGRRAVFDSSTKQFIRWADKEPANAN